MADAVSITDTIISTVGSVATEAAEAALIAQFPFLGLPIIKQIWEYLFGILEQNIISELEKGSTALIITVSEDAHAATASATSQALNSVQNNPNATAEEISSAQTNFKNAYAALIGFRANTPAS